MFRVSSIAPQAWDGGGERNAWLGGAREEGESKCSSGGNYWKDITEEEFINPRGFSRLRLDLSAHQRGDQQPLGEAAGVRGKRGWLRHRAPTPHPETRALPNPSQARGSGGEHIPCSVHLHELRVPSLPRTMGVVAGKPCWHRCLLFGSAAWAKMQAQPAGCRERSVSPRAAELLGPICWLCSWKVPPQGPTPWNRGLVSCQLTSKGHAGLWRVWGMAEPDPNPGLPRH